MSFPIIPFLTMVLLISGISAFLWDMYRVDQEQRAAEKALKALLLPPNDMLDKEHA